VDSLCKVVNTVFECAASVGVKPWDVHVAQITDGGMLLKITPTYFVPFVKDMTKHVGKPILEVRRYDGSTTTLATFECVLGWPGKGQTTEIDDQLQLLTQRGVSVEKPTMQVVVVAVGNPIVTDLLQLMTESESAKADAEKLP
jgi:hypothetical protein